MIEPGIEAEPKRREPLEPGAEIRLLVEMRPHVVAAVADDRAFVPAGGMTHAAEMAAARPQMRQQHRLHPVAEGQIGIADDTGRDAGRTVIPRGAHRGDAGDKLGLADGPEFGGAARAVHRAAFQEHGCDDVVAGVEVGEQFVDEIAVVAALP